MRFPAALRSGRLRGDEIRDVNGREMIIEAEDEPLAPIIDGERFDGIVRLVARAGPQDPRRPGRVVSGRSPQRASWPGDH